MPRRKRQPTSISYQVQRGTSWWAYARHSPGPGQDIASQKQAIAEFAATNRITITRWFVDEAEHGSSLDRDQFGAMIAESGILSPQPPPPAAAGILVLNFSRLGRDQQMSQFLISGFRLRGWLVVPIQERESLPEGNFAAIFESLTHWKDQQRLEEITRDTKRGLRRVVTQQMTLPNGNVVTGFSGGGFPPVGYRAEKIQTGTRKDGSPRFNSYWLADETPDQYGETPWIRVCRAWSMMATGQATYRQIDDACHLFKSLHGYNDLFRRRTYLGVRLCGDIEVPNAHTPAVSRDDFARVQQLLDARLRPVIHHEQAAACHLLPGLVVCGYCGGTLVADRRNGSYVCRTRRVKGRAACPHSQRTPIAQLEAVVVHAVATRVLTGGGMQPLIDGVNAALLTEGDTHTAEIERADRRAQRLADAVETLLDALERGGGSAIRQRLATRQRELETALADVATLKRQAAQSRPSPVDRMEFIRLIEDLRAALECAGAEQRRAVLGGLLSEVRVYVDQVELRYHLPLGKPDQMEYPVRDSNPRSSP